jgi:nucleoside-diphosphate-sugar epimerase
MNELVKRHPEGIIPFPIQGTGQETRSFCYIDDCVDQLTVLTQEDCSVDGIYHVGTMDERTIEDVAHGIAACYDREIKILPGTLPKGSPPRRLPDTAKIRALRTTWTDTSFESGLAETVSWYQAHAR